MGSDGYAKVEAAPTILEIASQKESPALADRLRVALARDAVEDPAWLSWYLDRWLEADRGLFQHPEDIIPPDDSRTNSSRAVISRHDASLAVSLEVFGTAGDFFSLADSSWYVPDLVAAVVGAELWMTSLGASNFSAAVWQGPAAVSSASALVARAMGEPVAPQMQFAKLVSGQTPAPRVAAATDWCRSWVVSQFGSRMWANVVPFVVSDLLWKSNVTSRTAGAGLYVGLTHQGVWGDCWTRSTGRA